MSITKIVLNLIFTRNSYDLLKIALTMYVVQKFAYLENNSFKKHILKTILQYMTNRCLNFNCNQLFTHFKFLFNSLKVKNLKLIFTINN